MAKDTVSGVGGEQASADALREAAADALASTGNDTAEPSESGEESGEPESEDQTEDTDEQGEDTGEGEAEGEGEEEPEDESQQLLSNEELEALKDNPKALKKALQRAFTQKTQALSAAENLRRALVADPKATIRQLAQQAGLTVGELASGVIAPDAIQVKLGEYLGPELAGNLAPIIRTIAAQVAEERLAPVHQALQRQMAETAVRQSNAVLREFGSKHPGWKKHEKAMMALTEKVRPQPGTMDELEYLEHIYTMVTAKAGVAANTERVISRLDKSARASRSPNRGEVSSSKARAGSPNGRPTLAQALAAASDGVIWDDD